MRVTAIVVNFNTARHTQNCVASLAAAEGVERIVVVDNGSTPDERARLDDALAGVPRVELIRLESNQGFAEGSNIAIRHALGHECDAFLLLNSDAVLAPGAVAALTAAMGPDPRIGLVGGRVVKPSGGVDSLGIAFYASCLASNRMSAGDRYFGPTGSCAIYRRELFERLQAEHGHVFDQDFFCYAEDTDVAARALLLGYEPGYVDAVVATHEGQVSSGGGFSDFVLYHGIRNSVWMMVKCVPGWVLLLCAPLIVLMHVGILLRHGAGGRPGVVRRLYRDAWRGLSATWRKRRAIQRTRRVGGRVFLRYMTPRFYDADYLSAAVKDLLGRGRPGRAED